jgi:hypothetical protein
MIPSTTLAYAAGIVDGEGSITLNKQGGTARVKATLYRVPVIQVSMTAKPVIQFLVDTFNGVIALRPRNCTDLWEWRASNSRALDIMAMLRPHMMEPNKIARIDFLLSTEFRMEQADRRYNSPEKEVRRGNIYERFFQL